MQEVFDTFADDVVDKILSPNDPYRSYAPVVYCWKRQTLSIHITDQIIEPVIYARVVDALRSVDSTMTVYVYVNTNGGSAATADLLYRSIKQCKAKTIGIATGIVASAGTVVLLACDEFEVSPTASFLFHEGVVGLAQSKVSDARVYQAFFSKQLTLLLSTYYENVLSTDEIEILLQGTELWLNGNELSFRLISAGKTVHNYDIRS